jgi:outer membrane protein assembly factor BamB
MNRTSGKCGVRSCCALATALWGLGCAWAEPTLAQPFTLPSEFQLAPDVKLAEVDDPVKTHLELAQEFLLNGQWEEAVETYRRLMEEGDIRVMAFGPGRYVGLRDYCHMQVAGLPQPGLELYRRRVDPQARMWLEQGRAGRDPLLLERVVHFHFASSAGDEALLLLGDMALERGEFATARAYWQQLIEVVPASVPAEFFDRVRGELADDPALAGLLDEWYRLEQTGGNPAYLLRSEEPLGDQTARQLVGLWRQARLPPQRLAYPETDVPLAEIRARLVLASILEGDQQRATEELAGFVRLHPEATGRLAGRAGRLAELLLALARDSAVWPAVPPSADWTTFGGSPQRNAVISAPVDVGGPAWAEPIALPQITLAEGGVPLNSGSRPRRVAEDNNVLLSYHPVVSGHLLLVNDQTRILAYDLRTGQPAWPAPEGRGPDDAARIFRGVDPPPHPTYETLGAPRFTLTVSGSRLYARMGQPITAVKNGDVPLGSSYLVCLDLAAQGRVMWKVEAEEGTAFEGTPVADAGRVYAALRRGGSYVGQHVAAFDALTGRLLWKTHLCDAETPARGDRDECTHNLLTLAEGSVYCNTNLGAVASLAADDGSIRWVSTYPRAMRGDLSDMAAHWYRDLTPCLYDRGLLFVAPADSEQILCLDAATGARYWHSRHAEDAVHLLGVAHDHLLASGDRLYRFHIPSGKMVQQWPREDTGPRGYGRGALIEGHVLFPTRERIHVFSTETGLEVRQPIELTVRGAVGGNLVVTPEYLLIAGDQRLWALSRYGTGPDSPPAETITRTGGAFGIAP